MKLDFERLARQLHPSIRDILFTILPGGKLEGREYCCGSLRGEQGKSLKFNIDTQKWADFATGERGSDIISLYAAVYSITMGEAYKRLRDEHNITDKTPLIIKKKKEKPIVFVPCPIQESYPKLNQGYTGCWNYYNEIGLLAFVTVRYEKAGKKYFNTHSYNGKEWIKKAWPSDRPLYNLKDVLADPDKAVLIVEGEKTADAAKKLLGEFYTVVTFANGSSSWNKTNWSSIYGKPVLIWPDADEAGAKLAGNLITHLSPHCESIKIIKPEGKPNSWDAADALIEGMTTDDVIDWAKENVQLVEKPVTIIVPEDMPDDEIPMPEEPPTQENILNVFTSEDAIPDDYVSPYIEKWEKIGIARSSTGAPILNIDNVCRYIKYKKDLNIWFDTFHNKIFTNWPDYKTHEWTDHDTLELTHHLQNKIGLSRIADSIVEKAVNLCAKRNKKSEPKDFLKNLEWDGTPRVEKFFHTYTGASDNEYTRAVSQNWFISIVARIFKPGCKSDNMVIIEGHQGSFKSTMLSIIGGKWYTELNEDIRSKDFYQALQGKLIVEIGELDSFNKAEVTTIKKVVSTATDRFRAPYERTPQDWPRQCILVGTTNEDNYLRDHTGARRFWPIRAYKIRIEAIKEDRDQLLAEAVHLFKAGVKWHSVPEDAIKEQEARREQDEWEEPISAWLDNRYECTIYQVAKECLGFETDRINTVVSRRIGKILKIFRWTNSGSKRIGGRKFKYYINPDMDAPPPKPEQQSLPNYAPNI